MVFRRTLIGDLRMGLQSEKDIKPILEAKFGMLEKTSTYHPMDYQGDVWIEIKTRNVKKDTYPTTMLPYSKIVFAKTADKPVWFIFVFTDGIYYIEYSEELFDTFTVNDFQRTGRDVYDKKQEYIYIPKESLSPI